MTWHLQIHNALRERDAAALAFAPVFATANGLAAKTNAQSVRIAALEAREKELEARLAVAEEFGSAEAQKRLADAEAQLNQLKDEQRDMYRTQSLNAQRLLEMVESIKADELRIKMLSDENATLRSASNTLSTRLKDAADLLREKDGVIQILKDELAALQLELVQREEQLKLSQERLAKLEAENAELVDRWIQLKQEEAARMNEANEFVETALKSKKHELTHGKSSREMSFEDGIKGEKVTQCIPPSVAVKKLNLHDGDINCIQINREGTLLVTGGNDKKVIISDASTGAVKTSLIGCMQAVMSVSFSLKGDLVMATSNDNSVKVWSLATSRLQHTLTGHIGKVFSAKFTDSNRVISGSHDRTLKLWDLNKGYCVKTIFTLSSCNDLDLLDGDGTLIVSGHLDNNLRVWDTRSGNLVREVSGLHSGQISSVVVAPNRNYMLTTSRDNILKLIDIRTFDTVVSYHDDNFRVGMNWSRSCFSSDGVYVASGSADGALYVWNSESAKVERVLKDHRSAVSGVVWSPRGGSIVFSAEKEKGVICWGSAA